MPGACSAVGRNSGAAGLGGHGRGGGAAGGWGPRLLRPGDAFQGRLPVHQQTAVRRCCHRPCIYVMAATLAHGLYCSMRLLGSRRSKSCNIAVALSQQNDLLYWAAFEQDEVHLPTLFWHPCLKTLPHAKSQLIIFTNGYVQSTCAQLKGSNCNRISRCPDRNGYMLIATFLPVCQSWRKCNTSNVKITCTLCLGRTARTQQGKMQCIVPDTVSLVLVPLGFRQDHMPSRSTPGRATWLCP